VSADGPGRQYLDALARELRVGWRYRRRALAEIAAHFDDVAECERRRGASAEEAERVAIRRLGAVGTVADEFSRSRRDALALARVRALGASAYLGAALVVACALLARLTVGDSDGHLGLETAAAIASAVAVMLIDRWPGRAGRARIALTCVSAVWIATTAALLTSGDVLFCGLTLLGVGAAVTLVYRARRLRWRPR
jgi:hypothetical protein